MLVNARENFVAGLERQSLIQHCQPPGRVGRQREIACVRAEMSRDSEDCLRHMVVRRRTEQPFLDRVIRVRVELPAVTFHRLADGLGCETNANSAACVQAGFRSKRARTFRHSERSRPAAGGALASTEAPRASNAAPAERDPATTNLRRETGIASS